MTRILILIILLGLSGMSKANNEYWLNKLDSTLVLKDTFKKNKIQRINFLQQEFNSMKSSTEQLRILDIIYKEYYVFQFDSAKNYVNIGLNLAKKVNNAYYTNLFTLRKAELLAIGGLYGEAVNSMKTIDINKLPHGLAFYYYFTYNRIYILWSDYCNDAEYTPLYKQKAKDYLRLAIQHLKPSDEGYDYYLGEYYVYVENNKAKAHLCYVNSLKRSAEESRIYAMSAFALAGNYGQDANPDEFLKYNVIACVCDLKSCTMENMALQTIAMFLFERNHNDLKRPERYINISMDDAKFYNNRLRKLEIAQKLPLIVSTYHLRVKEQNNRLRFALAFISILTIGTLIAMYWIHHQNKLLSAQRIIVGRNNELLSQLNKKLNNLNTRLMETNSKRETLAKLYINLCAKYIEKLNTYKTTVKRKIKANQVNDLLSTLSSSRLSEEDAAIFMTNFDKAFLDLYPSFIKEFNNLMTSEGKIKVESDHSLTTELRIFALIRLGVKDSSEIADLLFYSPHTIYNYRSAVKNKAIDKDSFERNVRQLCITNS